MAATDSKVTTNHDEIKNWLEARGGHPARVKGTGDDDSAGVLRIDYPGFSGEGTLEKITWEEFFETFEESKLAFLYQEQTKDGEESRFSKLINRDSANDKARAAGN
ncbi:MAG TPA: hypothetical protein VJU86_12465 [Pyrinomonadaceae bacterium]|nr:hypothetical protein [Pyrinomonadaceae bacterium]